MFIDTLAENSQLFLLIFVRIIALIQIAPLTSSSSIPQIAKIGLALFAAIAVFPSVQAIGYPIPESGLLYAGILVGEVLVGLIMGFILVVVYAAFLLAGQYFSLQMGFGASQVFDPLSQIEIPIMGQFINTIAMLVFVLIGGFQRIFIIGVHRSFENVRVFDFIAGRESIFQLFIGSLGELFKQALLIAFPILGTLFLVNVTMGLLAKAAPQMNLLMMGFPVAIGVAFIILFLTLPFLVEALGTVIDGGFYKIAELLDNLQGAAP